MFLNYKIAYLRSRVKVREAVPMSFLRQTIAYVLSESARSVPHAAAINTFDVTNLVEYGRSANVESAQSEAPLDEKALLRRALHRNYNAFFIKAIAHGLHHVPCLNGFFDYAPWLYGGTLYHAEDVNLSVTVHTKYGVVKPIVRNPHLKDIDTVASELRVLARKARKTDPDELYRKAAHAYLKEAIRQFDLRGLGALWSLLIATLTQPRKENEEFRNVAEDEKLQIEDILGATCTLANIGMMISGHQTVTVIIPPEISMFGIGDMRLGPGVVDGQVVPRYFVTICATMDHRAFDAGEAFPFYQYIKRYIDNPGLIYEWKPGDDI